MADPGRGRGRGLIMKLAEKSQSRAPPDTTPEASASAKASTPVSTLTAPSHKPEPPIGGRGRLAQMLSLRKPGEVASRPVPEASESPSMQSSHTGVGRGAKIIRCLETPVADTSTRIERSPSDVAGITQKLEQATVKEPPQSKGKSKYFREIKDTPPVVMKGESGSRCDVTANFIRLNFKENSVFEYEVKFDPEQDYKHLRNKLLYQHSDLIKENTFDGTILYLPHKLPDEVTTLTSTNPFDKSTIALTIIFKRTRRLSEMTHIYNVLFKHIMKDLQLVRFGREHFSEHDAVQIPQHQLEVWPGFVTAVDEFEDGLMLTLDSTHRVLRTQTVLQFISNIFTKVGNWKEALTETLVGQSVMTTYSKSLYRVDSIDFNATPKSTFKKMENGVSVDVSYIDYYKNNYGVEIRDWDQPMLISRKTRRVSGADAPKDFIFYLVPELCQMTGLTDDQRNNFTLMKDVATYTRVTPNQRHLAFKKYIKNVLSNERAKKRLEGWGLSLSQETIDLAARTLPPENIFFGNNVQVQGNFKAEWNSDLTRNPVIDAIDIHNWIIIYTKRDERYVQTFVDTMLRCSGPMGIRVQRPQRHVLQADSAGAFAGALQKALGAGVGGRERALLQVVVVVCPNARDDRYAAIKKICCVDKPIPSQVINAYTLKNEKKIRAITQKIALQINCKLGGTLWSIKIPIKSCMIVGIDSYHDAKRKNRSCCAFVASSNETFTRWYSKAVFQEMGQEIADVLKQCFTDAIRHYFAANGVLPAKIIIYRDGVGDGQLKILRDYEIPQLKVSIELFKSDYNPQITCIVVQKRINTRIFMRLNGGYENPNPGTVLDHSVTRRDWYDFLIVSQKVNQGTVTPTHYVVVYDGCNFSVDQYQRLTYKLCHLYYNWPGTVRVPAPCQYAHKLASLAGQTIHQQPSNLLEDKLFFL